MYYAALIFYEIIPIINIKDYGSYLEVEDDGPDQAQGQLRVSVHYILTPDVDKLDLLVPEEPERCLHVLNGVETHAPSFSRLK